LHRLLLLLLLLNDWWLLNCVHLCRSASRGICLPCNNHLLLLLLLLLLGLLLDILHLQLAIWQRLHGCCIYIRDLLLLLILHLIHHRLLHILLLLVSHLLLLWLLLDHCWLPSSSNIYLLPLLVGCRCIHIYHLHCCLLRVLLVLLWLYCCRRLGCRLLDVLLLRVLLLDILLLLIGLLLLLDILWLRLLVLLLLVLWLLLLLEVLWLLLIHLLHCRHLDRCYCSSTVLLLRLLLIHCLPRIRRRHLLLLLPGSLLPLLPRRLLLLLLCAPYCCDLLIGWVFLQQSLLYELVQHCMSLHTPCSDRTASRQG
jgi:hypothetical protein